ncbi:hypothetical protein P7K49_032576 [Saguinus oedipus]|uniref:Uncharacterized protein n=1 Tax=Saguinus oedipus TaxID=9490 RepID=A0ABQ9TZE8_SAGOE|nr:hypothetical protein P7K49_032576 [Saguinus oedipus]
MKQPRHPHVLGPEHFAQAASFCAPGNLSAAVPHNFKCTRDQMWGLYGNSSLTSAQAVLSFPCRTYTFSLAADLNSRKDGETSSRRSGEFLSQTARSLSSIQALQLLLHRHILPAGLERRSRCGSARGPPTSAEVPRGPALVRLLRADREPPPPWESVPPSNSSRRLQSWHQGKEEARTQPCPES